MVASPVHGVDFSCHTNRIKLAARIAAKIHNKRS